MTNLFTARRLFSVCAVASLTGAFACPAAFAQDPAPSEGSTGSSSSVGSEATKSPATEAPATESPTSQQPSAKPADDGVVLDDEADTEGHGILGPYRVGATIGIGLPDFLHYGIDSRLWRIVGLSAHMGGFDREVSDVKVKNKNWNVLVRWFPFQGSFFLGSGIGKATFKGDYTRDVELKVSGVTRNVRTKFKGDVSRTNVPVLGGWQWILGRGLTLGLDAGWQIATGSEASYSVEPQGVTAVEAALLKEQKEYKDADKKVKDAFNDFKGRGLPLISVNVGWMI